LKSNKLWVVVSDLHFPLVHWPTWYATLDFIKHNQASIEGFLFLGDEFDNQCISPHTKGKPLLRGTGSYKKETSDFEKKILTPLEKLIPKHCKKVIITGNHSKWERDFVEAHPELEGIERFTELHLAERGWNIVASGGTYKVGKLVTHHGDCFQGYSPVCVAKRGVEAFAASTLQGHTHSPQSYTRVSPTDIKQTWMGYVSPIAGNLNPAYMRNKPNAWANGISIIETRPKGNFNCHLVISDRKTGEFSYGGKTYSGQK
jgi:hypothetical protein